LFRVVFWDRINKINGIFLCCCNAVSLH
jgi:hypothetical protein